jgi:hypothetical protein
VPLTPLLLLYVLVSKFGSSKTYREIKDIAFSLVIEWELVVKITVLCFDSLSTVNALLQGSIFFSGFQMVPMATASHIRANRVSESLL